MTPLSTPTKSDQSLFKTHAKATKNTTSLAQGSDVFCGSCSVASEYPGQDFHWSVFTNVDVPKRSLEKAKLQEMADGFEVGLQ